jgi:hypothetical protein
MAGRRRPPELPKPSKPISEMTPAERAVHVAQLRRALRDEEVRRGTRPPKTMREMEIWHEAQAAKEERTAARIARAERKQQRRQTEQEELADNPAPPAWSAGVAATPEEVGRWMAGWLQQNGRLYQRKAAREIAERFGDEFTYVNDNGNLAIDKRVLKAFREAPGGPPVWVRRGLYWRTRTDDDAPGRKQE